MKSSNNRESDRDDEDPEDDAASQNTYWGETQINEVIHEANQQQRDPEEFIKERKSGTVRPEEERGFRTLYQKPRKSFWKWLLRRD